MGTCLLVFSALWQCKEQAAGSRQEEEAGRWRRVMSMDV